MPPIILIGIISSESLSNLCCQRAILPIVVLKPSQMAVVALLAVTPPRLRLWKTASLFLQLLTFSPSMTIDFSYSRDTFSPADTFIRRLVFYDPDVTRQSTRVTATIVAKEEVLIEPNVFSRNSTVFPSLPDVE